MQLTHHYIRLRTHFSAIGEREAFPVTQQELAEILCCTGRNVKIILRQLVEHRWIGWVPGRGRGNHSQITFLAGVDEVVTRHAKQLVEKGSISEALAQLHLHGVRSPAKELFLDWLYHRFGYHVEEGETRKVDTLRIPFYRPLPALDPAHVVRSTESHLISQLFDTLVRYDARSDAILPHIAHYWETDEEQKIWTFYLRKGVFFHHGRELTAMDVKQTLERIGDPQQQSPFRWMAAQIEAVEVLKDTAVRIRLQQPNRFFLHYLSSNRTSIIPHEVCSEMGQRFSRYPVGTGPFRLVKNEDSMLVLEAFVPYFQGRAHLDRIEIWVVPDYKAEENGVNKERGELLYHPFEASAVTLPTWKGIEKVALGSKYITFNLNKSGPHQHPLFRTVLGRLLDPQKMIAELGGSRYLPAFGFLPGQQEVLQPKPLSERELKQLLQASGYRGEVLKLYTYQGSGNEPDAAWVKQQCKRLGIEVEVSALPIEQLKRNSVAPEADMILAGEVFDDDLHLGLVEMYLRENSFIRYHASPALREMFDSKIANALQEEKKARRLKRLMEIEEELKNEQAILFLYHTRQSSTFHPSLKGVSLNSLGWVNYKDIWF